MSKSITGGAAAAALALGQNPSTAVAAEASPKTIGSRPKIIFLDVNETLLDLAPLKDSVGAALNGKKELLSLWFTTMLQYSLVNTVADRYEHFTTIGAATLRMVAKNHGVELSTEQADKAIAPIRSLKSHPDVEPAMAALKKEGFKLVTLTNSSAMGVEKQMKNSELQKHLTDRLSVESVGYFKPHPHVYKWAARQMKVDVSECMLIAAHGWDIAGALWAGMRGAFLSRPGHQLYPLAAEPEINEANLKLAADRLIAMPK